MCGGGHTYFGLCITVFLFSIVPVPFISKHVDMNIPGCILSLSDFINTENSVYSKNM